MSTPFDPADTVESRINKLTEFVAKRLEPGLTEDGKVDLDKLAQHDAALKDVLENFALSKTWRDDPIATARDVAKLLEAKSSQTPLGESLEKLGESLNQ